MTKRILVVEDSATQAEALRSLLEPAGYEVSVATSGEQALTEFAAREFDTVLSDIVMPGPVDGYELCRRIKSGPRRETPVVLLTSLGDPMDIIKGLESGADNFFTKPYDAPHLLGRLAVLFETKAARRESKMRVGIKVVFMGREFTISSDREQILDLLISTFEDAVRQNRELRDREAELQAAKAELARYAGALEQRLRSVLASIPDVLFSIGTDFRAFHYASPACGRVFGIEPDRITFEYWQEHIHPDDRDQVLTSMRQAAQSRTAESQEYRFLNGSTVRWISQVVVPASGRGGQVTHLDGVARDVTDRKNLQEQFHQAQKMESVGRLAGGVAHDFNNLLTVILGETDIGLAQLPPEHGLRGGLEEVRKAAERAAGLTRQLLAFSRQQLIEPSVFSVNELVQETDKMLQRLIGEDIERVVKTAPDLGAVRIDRGQLEQVLVNLVVNARDAMPEGGKLTVETANVTLDEDYARVHAEVKAGEYVMLAVSDSGVGMTQEVKAHIFEPFFTTKERGKGTGLGLATCYGILKQAGGHINAYSEVGVGTTMKVYLPRVRDASPPGGGTAAPTLARGSETILLVEDEEPVRRVAARMLAAQGYRVVTAANGEEALQKLSEKGKPVDLLLTDLVLPGISGRVLAERARVLRPNLRVLYASGYTRDVTLRNNLLEHRDALIHKPYTADSLARKVREVLDA